jgi:ribosomal protein S18 acetylase RimI-like enzyme
VTQPPSSTDAGLMIRRLEPGEPPPWELLLLADPSRHQVEAYLADGICCVASLAGTIIGEFVLVPLGPRRFELMNIAITESCQGRGLGKRLVREAIAEAKRLGAETLELGTGNSSLQQLALYQKCGFRIVGVRPDFFRDHYADEIYENGIRCLDMIRLSLTLI